ncbi:hypothetical protein [Synechocystis sp. FACHB-383]|uniref:hypothetical protein n=1 Tax=Synechocystis sp. FACHB-383 TaxID=2692864 RepID=UPI001686376A|nr:hypothetical protein [Synechocystis sp. FACHB-383]
MGTIFKLRRLPFVYSLSLLTMGSIMPPALADYSAIAQGVRGWGWASGHSTMEKARQAAIRNNNLSDPL